ncbi:uracil-DNA glycosylase [Balneolaceae bacterium ANBcel3]|nr:uracil-DNA glycosylase [Balneolaceae bacterium ANBcel3]
MGDRVFGLFDEIRDYFQQEEKMYGAFSMPEENRLSKGAGITQDQVVSAEESITDMESLKKVKTLDELRELCEQAEELKTDLEQTNLVFGSGNPEAKIMFIGEAPGAEEDKQGLPFVGRAGKLLTKIIESISFTREQVYIANILKHRPPNNRDPLPEERKRSLPYLYRQIELIQPAFIVCLGRVSAQTLLETQEPMKNLRGRFHSFHNDSNLLVTYHPAALLRNPAWKKHTWEDVQMLRKKYDSIYG